MVNKSTGKQEMGEKVHLPLTVIPNLFQDLRDAETRPKQVRSQVQPNILPHSANFSAISVDFLDEIKKFS